MLRKVSLWKPTLSLLKLREESLLKGLNSLSNKEEVLKRLSILDKNQKLLIEDQNEPVDKPSHKFLPKAFIYSEIYKRNPEFSITTNMSKSELIKNLSNLLMDERSFGTKSLRRLLRMNGNKEEFNVKEIINVLEDLQDPLTISNIDLNVLMMCDDDALIPIWNIIMKNIQNLSFREVSVVLYSASTTQNIFNKYFMEGNQKMSTEILTQFLEQALSDIERSTAMDCALLLKLSKTLTTIPSTLGKITEKIQRKMIEKYELNNNYEPISISFIAEALPLGCYSENQDKVNEIVKKLTEKLDEINLEQLIYSILGLENSGCKVPFEYFIALDNISYEDLNKVHYLALYELVESAIKNRILSENLTSLVLSSFIFNNTHDIEFLEMVVEYLYLHYKSDYLHMIITKKNALNKLFLHEKRLQLSSLLKIGIMYGPHADGPEMFTKILLELLNYRLNDQILKENLEFISDYMQMLLNDSKERPIYNYQFNSFETIHTDLKHRNISELFRILKHIDPANYNIFEYFSEYKNCEIPQSADFDVDINSKNIKFISKAIWRHALPLNVSLAVFNKAKNQNIFEQGDFTEALYYLSSMNNKVNKLIKEDWIKPGPFLVPLCYNLDLPITKYMTSPDALYDQQSLFGEPLVKSLIKLSQHPEYMNLNPLTTNLFFTASTSPKISSSLILSLFNTFKSDSCTINYPAFSTFLHSNISQLKSSEIESLLDFFKLNWNTLTPELQNEFEKHLSHDKLEQILSKGSNVFSLNKILQAQEELKANMNSLNIFESSIKSRLINSDLCADFIKLISKVNKSQRVQIASSILEMLSLTGNFNNFFESLVNQIHYNNLWTELSKDDLLNFFFIYRFSRYEKISIPENIEESFKFDLLKIDDTEVLNEHPVVKIKCYDAFKYTTELEPRYLVSNDLEIRKVSAELNTEIDLPMDEIMKYMKIYALLAHYKIKPTDKCVQAIKMFYKHKQKNKTIAKIKEEILRIINEEIKQTVIETIYSYENQSGAVMWKPDLYFKEPGIAFMIFSEEDYCYNTKGEIINISLIAKVIKTQLEKANNAKVISIFHDNWNKFDKGKKVEIVRVVRDHYNSLVNRRF